MTPLEARIASTVGAAQVRVLAHQTNPDGSIVASYTLPQSPVSGVTTFAATLNPEDT